MTAPDFQGQPPTSKEEQIVERAAEHWRDVGNDEPVQAIARLEEAAKQLIALNATLQGLYFAVFAFSGLREQAGELLPIISYLVLFIFFIPILFWQRSLYCATQVFVPQVRKGANLNDMSVGAWQNTRKAYQTTVDEKLAWLHRAHRWLIVSFATVLIVSMLLALSLPLAKPGPTQIIILTPTPMPVISPTPIP